jgi:hypothetical protein
MTPCWWTLKGSGKGVIPTGAKRSGGTCCSLANLSEDCGSVRRENEPFRIAVDVLEANNLVADEQVKVAEANSLARFGLNRVNDRSFPHKRAMGVGFHELLADLVAHI